MVRVTGHFMVISIFNGLEDVHTIKKNVMAPKKSKKKETGPCFSRTKMFCLSSKFVYVTAKLLIFRWFKFTLKPPYSIALDNLRLAIWDTSFWTFWLKFGHKEP